MQSKNEVKSYILMDGLKALLLKIRNTYNQ